MRTITLTDDQHALLVDFVDTQITIQRINAARATGIACRAIGHTIHQWHTILNVLNGIQPQVRLPELADK